MEPNPPASLFELLPIGAFRTTPDGRQLRANAALVRLNACASEAELLALINDIARQWYVDPERRAAFVALMDREGQVVNFESEVRRFGNGERIWVRENAFAVRDAAGQLRYFEGTIEDITAVRLAQQSLVLSERRLQALIQNAQVLTLVCDARGRIEFASPAAGFILGLEVAALLGASLFDRVHPDDLQRSRDEFFDVVNRRHPGQETSYRFQHADGRWRRLASLGQHCLDDPAVRGVVLNLRDITDAEQARDALLRSQQKYAKAFAASPDCLTISRLADGVYLEVNDRFLQLSGFSREAVIGRSSLDLHVWAAPDDRAAFIAEFRRLGRVRDFEAAYQGLGHRRGLVSISAENIDIDAAPCVLAISREITESRAIQTALRESEARLRLALQAGGQGLYDIDLETGQVIVNDEFARMLGHDPAQFRETQAAGVARLHPDDRARVIGAHQAYLAGELPEYRVEFRQRCADGGWKWILSVGCLVEPAGPGQHRRMLGTHTDLTLRKQAEQEREQLLGRLERAEAIARMGSWEQDLASGAVWWSDPMRALFGLRDDEAPAEDLRHLHPEDRRSALDAMQRAATLGQPQRVMVRSNPKRGPLRWFSASGRCELDGQGQPRRLSGTLIDVTALKQAEQALLLANSELEHRVAERTRQLASSERRYRRIFGSVPVAIMQQDWSAAIAMLAPLRQVPEAGRAAWLAERPALLARCLGSICVVEMNPMAYQLYGIPDDKKLFTTLADVFTQNGRPDGFADEVLALVAGARRFSATRSVRRPDGTVVEVLVSLALPGPEEGDGAVLVSIADITEIQRLSAALDASLARVTRANRELETFTYSVSHDLKAPLRGLDGYSQLLLRHHSQALDEEGRGFLRNIHTATLQMGRLIDDLLAYSRLERQPQALTRLPLAPVVTHVLAGFADDLARRNIRPQIDLADAAVRADAAGLTLALRNLVDNALKFSLRSAQPLLAIRARVTDTAVLLSVQDNGIGFDMKLHDRIFQIFQRLQRAEDYPGTGVGLAIVTKAMERMGGLCWAESAPGQGATFHLQLPAAS